MSFAVTILGSSGRFATLERASSGYLVRCGALTLLLDAGGGTWRNLLQHVDHPALDGVVVSHRHPDHASDLFHLYHARMYGQEVPLDPIPLWAPRETLDRLQAFADVDESFALTTVESGVRLEVEDAVVSFFRMAHPPETLGVRVEHSGGVFAYTSDTGPETDFEGLAQDADLLIAEATHQDEDETWPGHLKASDAARIASRHGVKRLVLTHLPHDRNLELSLKQAKEAAPGLEIELAEDNKTYEVVA